MITAITAATGQLGQLIVSKLVQGGFGPDVVAVVRNPAKAAEMGVAVRKADYTDPNALEKAFDGVDTLLMISSSAMGERVSHHRNAIAAAKRAGVRHIIYTSILHADRSELDLAEEHRQTERMLDDSGLDITLLRNGWYTENYLGSLRGALAAGAFLGSAEDAKLSLATREDYAEAAVAVLTSPGHEGQVYELAGDEAVRLRDVAAEVGRQAGTSLPYRNLPVAEYASVLTGYGIPNELAHAIAGWDEAAALGALFDDSHQLSKLIGRPTTPLAVAVQRALAATSE